MLLRILGFLVAFAALQAGWEAARGTALERAVVDRATVGAAAEVLAAIDPDLHVRAAGTRLVAPGGGLNVLAGCEGVDVLLLLASAMLVAPLAWRHRLLGLLVGSITVYLLNQGRIVALFYANRIDRELFALLHGVVTPLVMVVAVAAFFVAWLARHPRSAIDMQRSAA